MDPIAETNDFKGTPRFAIRARLGAGGMGVVYRAHDRERGTDVALKMLYATDGDALLRLKQEFRALRDVSHPNLVSLGELIEDSGRWFYTMELIDGVDFVTHVRGIMDRSIAAPADPSGARPERRGADDPQRAVTQRYAAGTTPPPGAIAIADTGQLDEDRLRTAFVQLGRGLHALHAAGKIHRDVKPSNVLVAADGRVVLLDFGLVVDGAQPARWSTGAIVGTTAYMAPEQAAGQPLDPAADWYAAGALLYEALTGELPFSGPPVVMLLRKQEHDPPRPRELVSDLPGDLDALCVDLLRRAPTTRPTGRQVLERLQAAPEPQPTTPLAPAPLIGRDGELARLWSAFLATTAGRSVAVTVRGESGVGKSYLVRRFLDRVLDAHDDAVVLAGRCYDRESVPYKAFDGIVDELAAFLVALPAAEVEALLPERVGKLARIFPVLGRVEAIARAPRPDPSIDPQQLRARAFTALRELLARLAARRRLVLVIDDLPRTDGDSLALLRELLRPPDAPALLLVTTSRDGSASAGSELTSALALADRSEDVRLDALTDEAAHELVAVLARPVVALSPAQTRTIADEARRHPLFIQELIQQAALGALAHGPGPFRVDHAILGRIARLDVTSRALVELIVVAGKPLPQALVARAAGEAFDDVARRITSLCVVNLLRASGARPRDTVEPYHDRVREAVLGGLPPAHSRDLHERLALALEATADADAEEVAAHWRDAGQGERAVEYALRAAEEATAALAFRRAASLYQLALELGLGPDQRRRAITMALGDSLANAGQGGEAARAYVRAADGAPPALRAELERRAAAQFLRAGYVDEGLEQARLVLARVGIRFPRSRGGALTSVLYQRARLRVRGLGHQERRAEDCAPADLAAIDACGSMVGLAFADAIMGAAFNVRGLRLALRAGEPGRLSRHLAAEAVHVAQQGSATSTRADELLAVADGLAGRGGNAGAQAYVVLGRGLVRFIRGHFAASRELFARAIRQYEGEVGVAWELFVARLFALVGTCYVGDLCTLAREVGPLLAEADDRGDLFSAVSIRVALEYQVRLFAGRPQEARRGVRESMQRWSQSGFYTQHRHALVAEAETDLYEGNGGAAARRFERAWRAVERSQVLRVRRQRIETHYARARAAVMAAAEHGADVRACHATAQQSTTVLLADGTGWAAAFGRLVRAGVAAGQARDDLALTDLGSAVRAFDVLGMELHAAAARRRQGELLQGSEGAALRARADAWMTAAGVANLPRVVALLAPGFGD